MPYSEALEILRGTCNRPVFHQALSHLRPGCEISLLFDGRFEMALSHQDGEVRVEGRQAKADVQFLISPEALRTLSAHPADNMASFGVAILEQILQGFLQIKVIGSMWRVLRDGYLKIILAAGPDFMGYLAKHGLNSTEKIISLIRRL